MFLVVCLFMKTRFKFYLKKNEKYNALTKDVIEIGEGLTLTICFNLSKNSRHEQ